jgi:meso-butanediol dehydrogenase/(S,S)-butanediol dehydrogenase/diacetyl reductase
VAGRVQGKVVIVTGGGSGIGAATAKLLAREGAHVVLCGRRRAPLDAVVKGVAGQGGRAEAHVADVTDEAQFRALVEQTAARHGRLDVLVNNAYAMYAAPIQSLSAEQWRENFTTTLDAAFFGIRAALGVMGRQGGGSIVNVSSTAGHAGQAGLAGYSTAKAALENLTRNAAVEGAPLGVRVNTLAPGVIATEGTEAAFADPRMRRAMERMIPLGRLGRPEEIASGILFFASDESSFATGSCLVIDGGQRASLGAPTIDEGFQGASAAKGESHGR